MGGKSDAIPMDRLAEGRLKQRGLEGVNWRRALARQERRAMSPNKGVLTMAWACVRSAGIGKQYARKRKPVSEQDKAFWAAEKQKLQEARKAFRKQLRDSKKGR